MFVLTAFKGTTVLKSILEFFINLEIVKLSYSFCFVDEPETGYDLSTQPYVENRKPQRQGIFVQG